MMYSKWLFGTLLGLAFIIWACSPTIESRFLSFAEMGITPTDFETPTRNFRPNTKACNVPLNYAPDTNYISHFPKKQLRINIHWMNSADSTQNITGPEADEYIKGILHAMNYALANNKQMWLPHGNNTPLLPINIEYVLAGDPNDPDDNGIYYHYDDSLYYYVHIRQKDANLFTRDVFDKYGKQKDTVLNMFMMPHHKDSLLSAAYPAESVGVALRNFVKVTATWKEDYAKNSKNFWKYRGVINHEVGHILGLAHSWGYNDGCDDTPRHPQECWSRSQSSKCDTLTSNNVMDYNNMQLAFSPCQIGKMHSNFANAQRRSRRFLKENWCQLDSTADITIRDTIVWECMKDLQGNLTIAETGYLTVRCRLSIPPNGFIRVKPGGILVVDGCQVHQACGQTWQGIIVDKQNDLEGQVLLEGDYSLENIELRE